jgi:hypothetical protein
MPFEFMQKGAKSETFEFADRFIKQTLIAFLISALAGATDIGVIHIS